MARYAIVGGPDIYFARDTATNTSVSDGMNLEEAQAFCREQNDANRKWNDALRAIRENDHS